MLQDYNVKHINNIISSIKNVTTIIYLVYLYLLKTVIIILIHNLYYCEYGHFVEILTNYSLMITKVHKS